MGGWDRCPRPPSGATVDLRPWQQHRHGPSCRANAGRLRLHHHPHVHEVVPFRLPNGDLVAGFVIVSSDLDPRRLDRIAGLERVHDALGRIVVEVRTDQQRRVIDGETAIGHVDRLEGVGALGIVEHELDVRIAELVERDDAEVAADRCPVGHNRLLDPGAIGTPLPLRGHQALERLRLDEGAGAAEEIALFEALGDVCRIGALEETTDVVRAQNAHYSLHDVRGCWTLG